MTQGIDGSRVGLNGKYKSRKNPTKRTLELIISEWGDASNIPLHDRVALQKADGIGAERAGQIVGASVVNGLIHRPIRSKSDY